MDVFGVLELMFTNLSVVLQFFVFHSLYWNGPFKKTVGQR